MERHCENAGIVAEYLDEHDDVAWVNYPGLESHETHDEASEYLEGGYGGMITFGLEGGYEAAKGTVENADPPPCSRTSATRRRSLSTRRRRPTSS